MINIEEIKKDYVLKNFLNYEKVNRNFNKIIENKSVICRLFPGTENIFKEIFDNLEKLEWANNIKELLCIDDLQYIKSDRTLLKRKEEIKEQSNGDKGTED